MTTQTQTPEASIPDEAPARIDRLYGEAAALAKHIIKTQGSEAAEAVLQAYDDERETIRQADKARWEAMRVEVEAAINADFAARPEGEAWTRYRPFVNTAEMAGAMKCGSTGHKRGKSKAAAYVSYIGRAGRTVLCQSCYERQEKGSEAGK